MLTSFFIKQTELPEEIPLNSSEDLLQFARVQIVNIILRVGAPIGTIAMMIMAVSLMLEGDFVGAIPYLFLTSVPWILMGLKSFPQGQMAGACLLMYAIGIYFIVTQGTLGLGRLTLHLGVIGAVGFYNLRVAFLHILFTTTAFTLLAYLIANGTLAHLPPLIPTHLIFAHTINYFAICLLSSLVSVFLLTAVQQAYDKELALRTDLKRAAAELQEGLDREHALSQSLRQALEKQHEANKVQERLITAVSHEFRTPMTVIRTSSDVLHKHYDKLSAERQNIHYQNIETSIERLASLIDKIIAVKMTHQIDLPSVLTEDTI